MQVIIMAGGEGERLRPITSSIPKPLISLCGKPCAEYITELLEREGFEKATMTVSYLGHMLSDYFSGRTRLALDFVFEDTPLGTAGCVKNAWDGKSDVLVMSGDALCSFNLKRLAEYHKDKNALVTIALKRVSDPREYGLCDMNGDGVITGFIEKPSFESCCTDFANTGVYIISSEVLRSIESGKRLDFARDIFPGMLNTNRVFGIEEEGYWCDIGDIRSLMRCMSDMLDGKTGLEIPAHRDFNGAYYKKQTAFRGVAVRPPVYIGSDVTIMPGAVIEQGSVIEDNAVIGEDAKISGSFVGKGARVMGRSSVYSAYICDGAAVDGMCRIYENAVVGQGAQIGQNSVVDSGVKIWPNKHVEQGTDVMLDVKKGSCKRFCIDDEGYIGSEISDIPPHRAALFGEAVGSSLGRGESVIVGYSRKSSITDAFCAGVTSAGVDVWRAGECCEPQLVYCGNLLKAKLCVFISETAATRIKVMSQGGLGISRETERKIESGINRLDLRDVPNTERGRILSGGDLTQVYASHLESLLPNRLYNVCCEIKASSPMLNGLYNRLIYPKNDIRGRRITFHFANDAARVSAYTEETGYVFYEQLCLLAMKIQCEKGVKVFSLPFAFPKAADTLAGSMGASVIRYHNTPCNESDSEAVRTAFSPDNSFVRDMPQLMCIIVSYLSKNGITLKEAMQSIPQFFTGQRFVYVSSSVGEALKKLGGKASAEGVLCEENGANALVRPIKSGKGLMIFAEAYKYETAQAMCDEIERKLKM